MGPAAGRHQAPRRGTSPFRAAGDGLADVGEYRVEWTRQPAEIDCLDEQACVTELALGTRAEEAAQLRFGAPAPPGGLPSHAVERAKITLRAEKLRDPCGADGANELVLQVLVADVKAHVLQVGTRPRRADAGNGKTAPEDVLF